MVKMKNTFEYKTHGRIFVMNEGDIAKVHEIIKALDEAEEHYMPTNFIAVWKGQSNDIVYGHKFEADLDAITIACWDKGVPVLCVTGKRDPLSFF